MVEKRATGWVPDFPDVKDFTIGSKPIRDALLKVQGQQVSGSLESQQDNILGFLKEVAATSNNKRIKSLQKKLEDGMKNEISLVQAQLLEPSNLENKNLDSLDFGLPNQILEIITLNLFSNAGKNLVYSEEFHVLRLRKVIYPIVKIIAQLISCLGVHGDYFTKKELDKAINYFNSLFEAQASEINNSTAKNLEVQLKSLILELEEALIKATEKNDKYSNSDNSQSIRVWRAEHQYFEPLAYSAMVNAKNKWIEACFLLKKIALKFQGYYDYVYMENFQWQAAQSVTVEFWMKINHDDIFNGFVFFVGYNQQDQKSFSFQLRCKKEKEKEIILCWDYRKSNDESSEQSSLPGQISVNYTPYLDNWTHVALVSDGKSDNLVSDGKSNKFMRIYLNGKVEAQNETPDSPEALQALWIGSYWTDPTDSQELFKGEIADFRIWNQVRTSEQIKDNMSKRLTDDEENPVGYWKFDEGDGDRVVDCKSTCDGVLMAASENKPQWVEPKGLALCEEIKIPQIYEEVKQDLASYFNNAFRLEKLWFTKALEFDGKQNYVYVENFEWKEDASVTVEFWVRVNRDDLDLLHNHYAFTIGDKSDEHSLHVTLPWSNSQLYWGYGSLSLGWDELSVDYSPYLDQWIHVAVVSEGKKDSFMGIYLDGELVISGKRSSDSNNHSLKGLWIGGGRYEEQFFKGKIADFRIWNQPRTLDQIEANMFKRLAGDEDGLVGYWTLDEITDDGKLVNKSQEKLYNAVLGGETKPQLVDVEKSPPNNSQEDSSSIDYITNSSIKYITKKKNFDERLDPKNKTYLEIKISQENDDSAETLPETNQLQFPILNKYLGNITKTSTDKRILPGWVDLSSWCSEVEDQGSLNSCTAHAAISLMEYFQKKSFGKYIQASRLFLYKATRNLMKIEGNVGTSIRNTMKAMALFGVPPEEYWPYKEDKVNEEPISFCYAFAQNYQALKYFRLDSVGMQPNDLLAQIKAILVTQFPCVFGFTLYHSIYDNSNPRGHIPFPHNRDKAEGGHAVVAVGYDDYKVIKNADGDETYGALLIKNCWGTKWGEGGYGWLPYEYVLRGLTADWWSLFNSEWFDTEQFDLGGGDWTDNVGGSTDTPTQK